MACHSESYRLSQLVFASVLRFRAGITEAARDRLRSNPLLEPMLYALAVDDQTLHVFSTDAEAIAYCEGYDVASGTWRFFAADGSPLVPTFSEPARKGAFLVTHGRYALAAGAGAPLQESMARVSSVEGPPGLQSVAEVARALTRPSSGLPTAAAHVQR